jgi:hypothetical protein
VTWHICQYFSSFFFTGICPQETAIKLLPTVIEWGIELCRKIVNEVSTAMWNNMQPIYLPQPTTEMWELIALGFEQRWEFPHCIGTLDGKHVMIKKPAKVDLKISIIIRLSMWF